MVNRNDKEDDDDYASVSQMADRLKLKKGSRERARYIHDHMTGLGYRMQPSYVRPDEDDDDDDGHGRFRFRGRSRSSRDDDDDGGYPF
jgi:hypothetical protein